MKTTGHERRGIVDFDEAKKFAREVAGRLATEGSAAFALSDDEKRLCVSLCASARLFGTTLEAAFREWQGAKEALGRGSLVEAARFYAARKASVERQLPCLALLPQVRMLP